MRPKTLFGFILMVGFGGLLFFNFGKQVGGYMDFVQAGESGSNAHVIGQWVRENHFQYDREPNVFSFDMRDELGNVRRVLYANPKPPNFEDADQLVVEGTMRQDAFLANHILVKCPSKYNDSRAFETQATSIP
jgi:cytochrome c-type biogenesis protein CcmE